MNLTQIDEQLYFIGSYLSKIGVDISFVRCFPGEFLMGSSQGKKYAKATEIPQHSVRITKDFFISKNLITEAQWLRIMKKKPRLFRARENENQSFPVEGVTWIEAVAFCESLSEMLRKSNQIRDGQNVILPSEAQWEYACRAGTTTSWFFGEEENEIINYGWTSINSSRDLKPIGLKKPNPWGLLDTIGNVSEWVLDDFSLYKNEYELVNDPVFLDPKSTLKVARGGSFSRLPKECRSASREVIQTNNPYKESVGFRPIIII